jgi:hypothetical protein
VDRVRAASAPGVWAGVVLVPPDRSVRWSGDTGAVILSRNWSVFLVLAGVFNWVVWPRFAVAIWNDPRAWSGEIGNSTPTSFLLVHAVLIITAVTIGTVVAALGVRGFLGLRRARSDMAR